MGRDRRDLVRTGVIRSSKNQVATDDGDGTERVARMDIKVFVLFVEEKLTFEVRDREGDDIVGCACTAKLGNR